MAVMAVAAGVRAAICMIAVPTPIRSVRAAIHVSGVTASEPHASDVHTESKPSRSASIASGNGSTGLDPQYPTCSPSLTARTG